jgi:hypothetical protein
MEKSEKPGNPDKENERIYAAETDINSGKIKYPEKIEKFSEMLVIFPGDFCQIVCIFFPVKFGRWLTEIP